LAAVALLLGAAPTIAHASDVGDEPAPSVPACSNELGVTIAEAADAVSRTTGADPTQSLDWLTVPGAEEQLELLRALVGTSDIAGYEADVEGRRIIVVPSGPGKVVSEAVLPPGPLALSVGEACRDALAANTELSAVQDWVVKNHEPGVGVTVQLDRPAGVTVATVEAGSNTVFVDRLQAAFPAVVLKWTDGQFQGDRGGRFNDGSPHYGGARILVEGNPCSSGFRLIEQSTGRTWMLTAAHCQFGTTQRSVLNGVGGYYGTTKYDKRFHQVDLVLIGSNAETYSNYLYLDPDTFNRPTVGTYDVPLYGAACVSGASSLATCGLIVSKRDVLFCPPFEFCRYTDEIIRPGYPSPWYGGDSGGPLYGKNTSTTVNARGIVSGSLKLPSTGYGYFTPIRRVSSVYGGFNLP
jgi:hypothetical protein